MFSGSKVKVMARWKELFRQRDRPTIRHRGSLVPIGIWWEWEWDVVYRERNGSDYVYMVMGGWEEVRIRNPILMTRGVFRGGQTGATPAP